MRWWDCASVGFFLSAWSVLVLTLRCLLVTNGVNAHSTTLTLVFVWVIGMQLIIATKTSIGVPVAVFLQVRFFCAMLQSGPWHKSVCTYCRSNALTPLKGLSLCIMLCSMMCRCLFIYDEGPVFLFHYVYNRKVLLWCFFSSWSMSMSGQSCWIC